MARLSVAGVGLLLLLALILSAEAGQRRSKTLRRKKREWILPPAKLLENTDYTKQEFIAKIRSDKDVHAAVEYYLTGPGADKEPYNLFKVDHSTGFVRITDIVDREKYPFFDLKGEARFKNGTVAEPSIPLTVTILDMNDNSPYFELHTGNISEASKPGTFVMQIVAKDNDQAGTINTEIAYSIVSQEPKGTGHMFRIDRNTGKVYVKEPTLDRETHDFYRLTVKGTDLGGAADGRTGTGTVEIKVLDINDNLPELEKSEYTGSVDENVDDVIVMRIKAKDKDLVNTDNWLAVFTIDKGNEDGLFSIETDPKTNEGILKLVKAVDYEEIQTLELGLIIENVAPLVEGGPVNMDVDVKVGEGNPLATGAGAGAGAGAGVGVGVGVDAGVDVGVDAGVDVGVDLGLDVGVDASLEAGLKPNVGLGPGVSPGVGVGLKPGVKPGPVTKPKPTKPKTPGKSYPIKIAVNNLPEGPAFKPELKKVPVSEDPNEQPEDGVLTVFAAVDPDTGKQAEDVSYAKAYDPDNWFSIDEETAEIKLNKKPDRESPFLKNGTYIAKILAISKDQPAKTATGTIAIEVTDANDHCPRLTTSKTSLCSDKKTVYVTGFDEDVSPNGAPFKFIIIPDGTRGSWDIEIINDTTAALHSRESLWPGTYKLQVQVADQQGLSCPADEVFTLDVCTCVDTEDCGTFMAARQTRTSSVLSAPAIGLLLMAMCLLLLMPCLLLKCQGGGGDTIFPDQFSDMPFDAKEHLISYHTEGKGEDKEVPLHSVPSPVILGAQRKVEAAGALNFSSIPSRFIDTHQTTAYGQSVFQETTQSLMEVDNAYGFSRETFNHANGIAISRQTAGSHQASSLFDDIALPDVFLNDYYTQKAACALPVKDSLMVYDFEGQGSPAGSVGCCSLLGSENDLQFISDLGPKFKTLAEICSPPAPTPKPTLTRKVAGTVKSTVDIVEPVVKPKIEQVIETKHTNIKTQKVVSSSNISKSSVSTVNTAQQSTSQTLPQPTVTNFSHSSNISHSATLPRPPQTVVLQQQPIYYTTTPVLQPMRYVVQPQLQNTVLLADGTHGANFPGVYVVSGPQGSPPGLIIQGVEKPKSPTSPTSSVSPTLLLPVSPGMSQGPLPVDGWKMVGPNTGGKYVLIQDKSCPGEAEKVDPGSSQGTLPRGAILVKEAAPPQGVLGPAAHGSVYGILPGHSVAKQGGVIAVNRNLGQTWVGQPGQIGLGPVTVLGVGAGQPQMGMGNVVAMKPEVNQPGILPVGISPVGIRQVNVNQAEGISPSEHTVDATGIPEAGRTDSPKDLNVVNTVITVVPSNEEVTMKNLFNNGSDPSQNIPDDTVEEKRSEVVITYTSEQHTTVDNEDHSEMVHSEEKEGTQECPTEKTEKSSVTNLEKDIVKSLQGPNVLQSEQSDTVVEKSGDTMDEIAPDQLNDITEAPNNKSTDGISQTIKSNYPQENAEEEAKVPQPEHQENHVPSEGSSGEDKSMVIEMSSTEDFLLGSDTPDLVDKEKENEETSTFPQGEEAISTSDPINIVEICGTMEENVDRQEAATLKEEVQEENKPDLETNLIVGTSDSIQAEDNMEGNITVTSNAPEEAKAEQKQLLDAEVRLSTVDDELSATPSTEISPDTVDESEETSTPHQEATDLQVNHSEEDMIDECLAETDIAAVEAKTSLQMVRNILTNQEEGDLGGPSLITAPEEDSASDGEKEEVTVEEGVSRQSFSTSDEAAVKETVSVAQQNTGVSDDQAEESAEEDAPHMSSQVDDTLISDNEEEIGEVVALPVQQNVSITNDQEEEIEREAASGRGLLLEDQLISGDNSTDEEKNEAAVGEMMSQVQQNIGFSDEQDEERVDVLHMSSHVNDTLISDNKEEIVEVEALQQNLSITDDQNEGTGREAASGRGSPLEDQLISDVNNVDEEKDVTAVEEMASPVQQNIGFSIDQDEASAKEDTSHMSSQVDDTIISDNEEETVEVVALQQNLSITDDQNEVIESEAALERGSSSEDLFISEDNIIDGVTGEDIVEEQASPVQQMTSISDKEEDSEKEEASHIDRLISGDSGVTGANIEGLGDVVTSSEGMRSSRVATGQVSVFSEDTAASVSILTSGQFTEGETQSDYQNTDVTEIEHSEGVDLTLEKGKVEVPFSLEVREGLNNASGQVSPIYHSEEVEDDTTTSSVLEADPGSAETEAASFIATGGAAEQAGYIDQSESVHMTREAAGGGQNLLGKAGSIEVVSEGPYYMHGAEASAGQVTPVELQTVISQTPRNKSRKSKKESSKSPLSPKSPSGKCKQQ